MSDQQEPLIRDGVVNPAHVEHATAARRQAAQGQTPEVDPDELADYAEFEAWKQSRRAAAAAVDPPREAPKSLTLTLPDGTENVYELLPVDEDTVAMLSALVTMADTDAEKASAVFDSVLHPDSYDKLKRDLGPVLRNIRRERLRNPDAPSVMDTWVALAQAIVAPLQELMDDPKKRDSLAGRSPTGPSSNGSSVRSALPSMS